MSTRFPIRFKLLAAIGVPLLAAYVATTWILGMELGARSAQRFESVAAERVELLANRADERFDRAAGAAGVVAAVLAGWPPAEERMDEILGSLLAESSPIVRVRAVLGGASGRAWIVTRKPAAIERAGPVPLAALGDAEGPWTFSDAIRWSAPRRSRDLEGFLTTCSVPVSREGALVGAVFVDLAFSGTATALEDVEGGKGRLIVMGQDGTILDSLSDPASIGRNVFDDVRRMGRNDLAETLQDVARGRAGIVRLPGILIPETVWIAHAPLRSMEVSVVTAVPQTVALAFERTQIRAGLLILTAGLVVILVAVIVASTVIMRPVSRLAEAVSDLGRGDLDTRIGAVESRDEIGELARAFDKMVADLKHHVVALQRETAAREAVLSELRVAREIQMALLPKRLPAGAEFALQARNLAARHVAGDFYDAFQVAGDRVVFLVADVSGKGLPSALFMAVSRIVLRRALAESASPAEAVREVNESLVSESVGSMYLTLFVGFYEPGTGRIRYVNAGHPLPWRVSARGKPSPFGEVSGGLVGLLPGMKFEEREEQLQRGDRLVVFTDGVPEARRGDEEFYGDERIAALLGDGPADEAAGPLCDRIIAAVGAFQNGNLADDVTVLTLVRRP